VSTITASTTPITEATVSWTAPTSNGGDPVDYYKVEWFTRDFTPEVQVVRLTYTATPSTTSFILKFPAQDGTMEQTGSLDWDISAVNMRNALLNLGQSSFNYIAGDIAVTRSTINSGSGYAWSITFGGDADSTANKGDQIELIPSFSVNDASASTLSISTYTEGVRSGGNTEEQVLKVGGTSDGSTRAVAGFFRAKVEGSSWSNYIAADATAAEVQDALGQLSTVSADVVVTKDTTMATGIYSHEYKITFNGIKGDVSTMTVDATYLTSVNNDAEIVVYGGDNSVSTSTNLKAHTSAIVGERPTKYGTTLLPATATSYTIDFGETGETYDVVVTPRNSLYGFGPATSVGTVTPPKQVPQMPQGVSSGVNTGFSDSMLVTWSPPTSNGGDTITRYRVELDETATFDSPTAVEDFYCPTDNERTVWEVSTGSSNAANAVVGGYFALTVTVNGVSETTDAIPYNAVALAANETGTSTAISTTTKFAIVDGSTTITYAGTGLQSLLFVGDMLKFDLQDTSTATLASYEYEVTAVADTTATITHIATTGNGVETHGGVNQNAIAYRIGGGRGDTGTSKIHCTTDDSDCILARTRTSGSMQSKINDLTNVVTNGVVVDRDGPDTNGGYTWRITFLDDAPDGSSDFVVSIGSETLSTSGNTKAKADQSATTTGTITAGSTPLVDGETYTACSGTLQVPSTGGLTKGTAYYSRVYAINSVGYSVAQSSSTALAPTVVPGAPTGVTLEVTSSSELRVLFSAPSNNGGAAVEKYLIEYDTTSAFSSPQTVELTFLSGGAPFFKKLEGLTQGTYYFVRVSAYNANGYGVTQVTTPSSLNPHQTPSAPSSVSLQTTSDSMLTVGWAAPSDNGGDAISGYIVEWDTSVGFNSGSLSPHKGSVTVTSSYTSTTIELLSGSTTYYTRVAAINSAGTGTYQTSSPVSTMPSLQVPGAPHSIALATTATSGEISVTWQYPKIPHHGVPCSGSLSAVNDCPTPFGSSAAESTGGSAIQAYEIEYNERSDFTGSDGAITTTTALSLTLSGLTPERFYFVRVLARNQQGSGAYCQVDSSSNQVSIAATA
jgi:hypothetical protein